MTAFLWFAVPMLLVAACALAADRFEAAWVHRILAPRIPAGGAPPSPFAGPPRPFLAVAPNDGQAPRGSGHLLPLGVIDTERSGR